MPRGVAGRPQESARSGESYALAEWFNTNVDFLTDMTNDQLAQKLGYTRPNIISMWRTGRTRIPLDRLVPLSEILNVDISYLLAMWVEQYGGGPAYAGVMKALKNTVSDAEMKVVDEIRSITRGQNFKMKSGSKRHLTEIIDLT